MQVAYFQHQAVSGKHGPVCLQQEGPATWRQVTFFIPQEGLIHTNVILLKSLIHPINASWQGVQYQICSEYSRLIFRKIPFIVAQPAEQPRGQQTEPAGQAGDCCGAYWRSLRGDNSIWGLGKQNTKLDEVGPVDNRHSTD